MSIAKRALELLPDSAGAVVCLSGGLDSTTTLRLAVEKYGPSKVRAVSFNYGQRQKIELQLAAKSCARLSVEHRVIDIPFLNTINQGFSANVDTGIEMPTIHDILGDPQPITYVANRNMILMSIVASFAETVGSDLILAGFQSNDTYGYWDTTPDFIKKMNAVLGLNRQAGLQIICPFVELNKKEEIQAVFELDGNLDLFSSTITCYNPDSEGRSCGTCPSCAERILAFQKLGFKDPIVYVEK